MSGRQTASQTEWNWGHHVWWCICLPQPYHAVFLAWTAFFPAQLTSGSWARLGGKCCFQQWSTAREGREDGSRFHQMLHLRYEKKKTSSPFLNSETHTQYTCLSLMCLGEEIRHKYTFILTWGGGTILAVQYSFCSHSNSDAFISFKWKIEAHKSNKRRFPLFPSLFKINYTRLLMY